MRRPCGAERPALRPTGWECLGVDLVIVMRGPEGVPVVVPRILISLVSKATEKAMKQEGHPTPFAGGDHLHLVLPVDREVAAAVQKANLYPH